MKKSKGGASKTRWRKTIKLEQAAPSCSRNIYDMFKVMRRATSELESQVILTSFISDNGPSRKSNGFLLLFEFR